MHLVGIWENGTEVIPITHCDLTWVQEYEEAVLRNTVESCRECYLGHEAHVRWHSIFRNFLALRRNIRLDRWGCSEFGFHDTMALYKRNEEEVCQYLQTLWETATEQLENPAVLVPPPPPEHPPKKHRKSAAPKRRKPADDVAPPPPPPPLRTVSKLMRATRSSRVTHDWSSVSACSHSCLFTLITT